MKSGRNLMWRPMVAIFNTPINVWSLYSYQYKDDKSFTYQIFLPLGKKESSAAKGCT